MLSMTAYPTNKLAAKLSMAAYPTNKLVAKMSMAAYIINKLVAKAVYGSLPNSSNLPAMLPTP